MGVKDIGLKVFHNYKLARDSVLEMANWQQETKYTYTFYNHFHPFIGELLEQLNKKSISGLLDVNVHESLNARAKLDDFFEKLYDPNKKDQTLEVKFFSKEIDVSEEGAYSIYNWELFFHVPLTIAVHLSKNQRFAEAQRWFHYIFDPTTNDKIPAPRRFWRFLAFRQNDVKQIDELLRILSKPADESTDGELVEKKRIIAGYEAIRDKPFHPHVVARTRFLAYQYCVLMKYLDNLIAWGDSLFRQDTIESINEATQVYVLAANLLGPKPQQLPQLGTVKPKTFADLRAGRLDPLSNALVELEGQFPLNLYFPVTERVETDQANPLFGIGRTLYFCIPRNDKLLSYWDIVADRLFKIRHCMNIEGVVRQLPLFEPPIDPGILVKAAAAGIDVSSLVSGLNQPLAPVRATLIIQKALEICSEVRSMGGSFLTSLEKKDAEGMSLLRQKHEINIQQLVQNVRFLQWKETEEATESLFKSRAITLERYKHYQRLLGKQDEELLGLENLNLERSDLTEDNFNDVYGELVGQYVQELTLERYPPLKIVGDSDPSNQSGATGKGKLFLNVNENADLNVHAPASRNMRFIASVFEIEASILAAIPNFYAMVSPVGVGGETELTGGEFFSNIYRAISSHHNSLANQEDSKGASASKTASYERRTDDWILQSNLAAKELLQIGRQIISSLIREQITRHEYEIQKKQVEQSLEMDRFLREKFTNEELYGWMQGELSKLFYECYKFAFDTARKAEQTMKHELMRPELDELNFIKFNYWDGGRKGLLSGEAMYLDLKRMEMSYHDHNKREYELTKHVSLRQLDPVALLALKATGTCEVILPEWLFDLDCPGHYMRRIKTVSLSIPSVTGPYTSVNCTLSLLKSSLRRSPLPNEATGEYARQGSEDSRFVDYFGTIQSVVTSSANNDSGMFETNLQEERFLPFEGAGAVSTWRLELPSEFRQFNYNTISDVILHVRYTARQGGTQLRDQAIESTRELIEEANTSGLVQLFSLKHDFPSEWHRFVVGTENFKATIKKDFFPYFAQGKNIVINRIELYAIKDNDLVRDIPTDVNPDDLTTLLNEGDHKFELSLHSDSPVFVPKNDALVFLLFKYSLI